MAGKICVLAVWLFAFQVALSNAQHPQLPEKRYNNARRLKSSSESKSPKVSADSNSFKSTSKSKSLAESKSPKSSAKSTKSTKSPKSSKDSENDDLDLGLNTGPSPAPTLWTKPHGFVQCEMDIDCTFGTVCVDIVEFSSTSAFENVTVGVEEMALLGNNTGICSEVSSGPYQSSSLSSRLLISVAALLIAIVA